MLLNNGFEVSVVKEKDSKRMIATTTCKNSKQKKDLNQLLKRFSVGLFSKHKKAKGESKTKTLIKTYRKEKFITKLKDEIYKVLSKIPLNEKMSEVLFKFDRSSFVNEMKEILLSNKSSPNMQK